MVIDIYIIIKFIDCFDADAKGAGMSILQYLDYTVTAASNGWISMISNSISKIMSISRISMISSTNRNRLNITISPTYISLISSTFTATYYIFIHHNPHHYYYFYYHSHHYSYLTNYYHHTH